MEDQISFSLAMAVPKGRGYSIVSDYRASKTHVELLLWPILEVEAIISRLGGVLAFLSLDSLQGYRHMELMEEAQYFPPSPCPLNCTNLVAFRRTC